jgi:DNA-binding transcriptional MerR regulator
MYERRWRIGELARATGVTVRALRHYEEAGLLVTAGRTSGEHRLYDEAAVERLYRIRALRGLGMSIEEIRRTLDDGSVLVDVLRAHLARIELEVGRLMHVRDRLRSITNSGSNIGAGDLLVTLDAMSRVEKHARARYRKRKVQGEDPVSHWRLAGERLRACMSAGDEPSSERARAAALDVRSLIEAFAEGNAQVLEALARLRAVDPPRDLAGWNPELTRYLDRALAALEPAQQALPNERKV